MCGPEDPLFTPLLPLARVPFQAKESVHKTPFWENLEILACTASIFTQILAHKPPNLEIFSSQAPKFGNFLLKSPPILEANVSSQAPHFGNLGHSPLPEKKLSAPTPRGCSAWCVSKMGPSVVNLLDTSERTELTNLIPRNKLQSAYREYRKQKEMYWKVGMCLRIQIQVFKGLKSTYLIKEILFQNYQHI